MICFNCGHNNTSVVRSNKFERGIIQRARVCETCTQSAISYERAGCPICGKIGQVTQTQKVAGIVRRWRHCQKDGTYVTHEERKRAKPVFTSTTSTSTSTSTTTSTTQAFWEEMNTEASEKPEKSTENAKAAPKIDIWADLEPKKEGGKKDGNAKRYTKKAEKRRKPVGKYKRNATRSSKKTRKDS